MITGNIGKVILALVGIIIVVVLIPTTIGYMDNAYVPTTQTTRYPIFGTALGGLVSTLLEWWPVVLFAAAIGLGYSFWRSYRSTH